MSAKIVRRVVFFIAKTPKLIVKVRKQKKSIKARYTGMPTNYHKAIKFYLFSKILKIMQYLPKM